MITVLSLILCSIWTEGFETQNYFPPDHWLIVNEDALDAVWYRTQGPGHSGIYSAACYYDTLYSDLNYTNLDYLITPRLLPQGSDTLVRFWSTTTSTTPCSLDVMVSTDSIPNMTAFNVIQTFLLTDLTWTEHTVGLGGYAGTPIYVAFRARRIPYQDTLMLDDITLPDMTIQPFICNGRLRTKGPPSQKLLQVWGTHYEMGFAHGYLLASEIMMAYIDKWIGYSSYHSVTPEYYEDTYLPMYREKYFVPQKFQDESQGIIDGISAKGVSLYHPALGRDLNAEDIWVITGAGKEDDLGCSSLSGWGESTINDDTLQGGFIIARNVDGKIGLHMALANASLIIAYTPSDPGEQRFFNVSFVPVFGAYSCINENGVGLCSNAGNHPDTNYIPPHSLLGALLASRLAVETVDPDGNGVNDIFDIDSVHTPSQHRRCNLYHVYSPYDTAHPIPAAVIEINNLGDTMRFVSDNYIPPAINSQWNLAVTNHTRILYPPVTCNRYQRIADSLNADFHLNTSRAIRIANTVAAGYDASTAHCTYHSMALRPDIAVYHPDWPCVGVSYARRYQAAHQQTKLWYSWNELFEGVVPVVEEVVQKSPEKATIISTILTGPIPKYKNSKVYDITGRRLQTFNPGPGIYFIERNSEIVQKVVKIK